MIYSLSSRIKIFINPTKWYLENSTNLSKIWHLFIFVFSPWLLGCQIYHIFRFDTFVTWVVFYTLVISWIVEIVKNVTFVEDVTFLSFLSLLSFLSKMSLLSLLSLFPKWQKRHVTFVTFEKKILGGQKKRPIRFHTHVETDLILKYT